MRRTMMNKSLKALKATKVGDAKYGNQCNIQ